MHAEDDPCLVVNVARHRWALRKLHKARWDPRLLWEQSVEVNTAPVLEGMSLTLQFCSEDLSTWTRESPG